MFHEILPQGSKPYSNLVLMPMCNSYQGKNSGKLISHFVSKSHQFLSLYCHRSTPVHLSFPFPSFPQFLLFPIGKRERKAREEIIAAFVWLPVAVIARAIAFGKGSDAEDPVERIITFSRGSYLKKQHSFTMKLKSNFNPLFLLHLNWFGYINP